MSHSQMNLCQQSSPAAQSCLASASPEARRACPLLLHLNCQSRYDLVPFWSGSKVGYFPSGVVMQCSGGIVGIVAPSQVETIKGSNPPLCITSFYDFLLYLTAGPRSQLSDMFLQLLHYSTPLGTRAVRESSKLLILS